MTRQNEKPTPPSAVDQRLVLALMMHQPLVDGMSFSLGKFDDVTIGREPSLDGIPDVRRTTIAVDDKRMSRSHARIHRPRRAWRVEDLRSKNGTFVNGGPIEREDVELDDGDVIELGSTLFVFRMRRRTPASAALEHQSGSVEVGSTLPLCFRTFLPDLAGRLSNLASVAPSKVSILVRGETGTGKELIARAIHQLSGRGEFVATNCGAHPPALIEAELFGHALGAFTGAMTGRLGLIRTAHGGTLFLDEVGDLPTTAQAALLRVLQERNVRPIGSDQSVDVDIRVVAATNRDLEKMMERGEFRRDLYARLSGFQLTLPPLRDRREDIGILVAAILRKVVDERLGVTIDRAAARTLLGYPYPDNIRELEQALQSAVLLARDGQIRLEHLPEIIQSYRWPVVGSGALDDHVLRDKLLRTLSKTGGNVAETGRIMNKAPMQIRRWCRRFDIDLPSFRRSDSSGESPLSRGHFRSADPDANAGDSPPAPELRVDLGRRGRGPQ